MRVRAIATATTLAVLVAALVPPPASADLYLAPSAAAGSHAVDDLIVLNGFRNVGTATEPLLLPPTCLAGWHFLAAELHVSSPVSVAPGTWGDVKAGYR